MDVMEVKREIASFINAESSNNAQVGDNVSDESVLADLGMSSLNLVTLILTLQRKYDLDLEQMIEQGMPLTVGELVTLLRNGARAQ